MRTTKSIHAKSISITPAPEEADTLRDVSGADGWHADDVHQLGRGVPNAPVEGRSATVRLSDGEVFELTADGDVWRLDTSTYATLDRAVEGIVQAAFECA